MRLTGLVYLFLKFGISFADHLPKCRLLLQDSEEFNQLCTEVPNYLQKPCRISISDNADYLMEKKLNYMYLTSGSGGQRICAPLSNNPGVTECVPASSEANQYNIDWTWSAWTQSANGKRRRKIIRQHNSEEKECPYGEIENLSDCEAIQAAGGESGVHIISPYYGNKTEVYCEMDIAGGGWTVVQQRVEGTTDFFRYWDDYVAGFGDRTSSYWLGLDNIGLLTKDKDKKLMVYMRHPDTTRGTNGYASATYNMFYIDDASDNYRLHVSGFTNGGAGESLSNGQEFSTRDNDNDEAGKSCAIKYSGAWWYSHCHRSNLNGLWASTIHASGIVWHSYTTHSRSLTFVKMMIKRADSTTT